MPLTFDEVGAIVEEVWARFDDDFTRMIEVRHTIGKKVFAQMGLYQRSPELVSHITAIDTMIPILAYYPEHDGAFSPEEIIQILDCLRTTSQACDYLTEHLDQFDLTSPLLTSSDESLAVLMRTLARDMETIGQSLAREHTASLDRNTFATMKKIGSLFFRLTLGDDEAFGMMNAINQANQYAIIHTRIALEAARIAHDPDHKLNES